MKTARAYVIEHERCPRCDADMNAIACEQVELEGQSAYQNAECRRCGLEWYDIFRMVGYGYFPKGRGESEAVVSTITEDFESVTDVTEPPYVVPHAVVDVMRQLVACAKQCEQYGYLGPGQDYAALIVKAEAILACTKPSAILPENMTQTLRRFLDVVTSHDRTYNQSQDGPLTIHHFTIGDEKWIELLAQVVKIVKPAEREIARRQGPLPDDNPYKDRPDSDYQKRQWDQDHGWADYS